MKFMKKRVSFFIKWIFNNSLGFSEPAYLRHWLCVEDILVAVKTNSKRNYQSWSENNV